MKKYFRYSYGELKNTKGDIAFLIENFAMKNMFQTIYFGLFYVEPQKYFFHEKCSKTSSFFI